MKVLLVLAAISACVLVPFLIPKSWMQPIRPNCKQPYCSICAEEADDA